MNKLALAAAGLAAAAVAAFAVWQVRYAPRPHTPATFVPTPNNNKAIRVRGWSEQELQKIGDDFCKLYGVPNAFDMRKVVSDPSVLELRFPGDIQPELFFFLVNYLNYPRDVDLAGKTISVLGRTPLTADLELPDERLVGQMASVYVPAGDTDYDNVYVRLDSGDTYVDSFSAKGWKRVDDARASQAVEALAN